MKTGIHVLAIKGGGVAGILVKQTAERSQTLKADAEANFRDGKIAGGQQFFGLFQAPLDQILVRRFLKSLAE